MTTEEARGLFLYNQWANRRMLDACAPLTPSQLLQEISSSFRSVRDTLAHVYGAEFVWYERLYGRSHPSLPAASDSPDLVTLRSKFDYQDQQWVDYTTKLAAADLEHVFRYKNTAGTELTNPLWQVLQHLSNHNTYHRGQITTMLRQLGAKPVSTDMIAFFREQNVTANA